MPAYGMEWIVEAHGCRAEALRDLGALRTLFADIVRDLGLSVVGEAQWHRFPVSGGVTGMVMLSESHITCHTFPEFQSICLNVFSCKPRVAWNFEAELRRRLGAAQVDVRSVERVYGVTENAAVFDAVGKLDR
ncbi:MAG: S-adenosylmethionine decarboxylase [Bryobacteraceae bacterium]